ncbi:MAG: CinA family protein [Planctomycetes bacterium]|nr:CinA family protein [Planctomycetota bacterium]
MTLEEQVGEILARHGLRLAVAETTAGGLICARLVSVPGSSRYLTCGIVAYSREAKQDLLGVPDAVLSTSGSVSRETAEAMAQGVRKAARADIGLAETGIAGPVRGRSPKPLGTAYIAVSLASATRVREHRFTGDRTAIREAIAEAALAALLAQLTQFEKGLKGVRSRL